jgi:hypothetical protein
VSPLIDSDRLFQQLLVGIEIPGVTVAADLDVDSFDDVPFVTHNASIAQSGNSEGIWTAALTVTAFIEANTESFKTVQALYDGIHAWGEAPWDHIVPGVGAVETIRDVEAFTRVGQAVRMFAKSVTQYTGSFELTIRNH